jgi:large subunit ribosomal protein L17
MRHRLSGRQLNRTSSHRKAMFSNMVSSLITHGRIETTEAKAMELRGIAERTINWSVKVNELCAKGENATRDERLTVMHAKREAGKVLKDHTALKRLFHEVAPTMVGRPGGYTRVIKTRTRRGDAAPMAFIELVVPTVAS